MTYRVRHGDTLYTIAARFGTTVRQLMNLNPQIRNPHRIYVGETITVPGRKWGKPEQRRTWEYEGHRTWEHGGHH